jgi:Zn-dependent peptidase ImmA (M78 family)
MSQTQSHLDQEPTKRYLTEEILQGDTNATLARRYNVSEAAIRRFRKRHGIQVSKADRAYTRINGDTAEG